MQNSTNALRARLSQLVAEHSQAKLARETGVTPSNISRYLAGKRMPADFCMKLVGTLGVNPAWLLAGEGEVYLADVNAASGGQARGMLELVRAMEAISRVKLGALSGKPDRRLLRELSDGIEAYEKLRTQLHMRTAGFLKDLLQQLHDAIEAHEMQRAGFLCNAARQASRFCDDQELARRLDHYEAHMLSVQRKDESALKLQHRAIARYLALAEPDLLAMREINAHSVYLLRVGRIEDARRTVRAARELALDQRDVPDYQLLRLTEGMAMLMLGSAREGGAIIFDAANRLGPDELQYYSAEITSAEYFLGLRDAATILAAHRLWLKDGRGAAVATALNASLSFCFWEQDAALIREAMALYSGKAPVAERVTPFMRQYAELLCALLEGARDGATRLKAFLKSEPHQQRLGAESPVDRFRAHATACDLALLAGEKRVARAEFHACEALMAGLSRRYQIPMLQLGLHHRNALALGGAGANRAREFFRTQFEQGYACFRRFAMST